MDMKTLGRTVMDFIWPLRCAVCGEITGNSLPLCPACIEKWQGERSALCPVCRRREDECVCGISAQSPELEEATLAVCHLGPYYPGKATAGGQAIYVMKDENYRALYEYFGEQLAQRIREVAEVPPDAAVIHLPRTKKRFRETGVDQGERLAVYAARELGIAHLPALINRSKSQQKKLNAMERMLNAGEAYAVKKKYAPELDGRTVILIDDILTTGASLTGAAETLMEYGAAEFIFATVLKTESRKSRE